jgi:hypothetical protein
MPILNPMVPSNGDVALLGRGSRRIKLSRRKDRGASHLGELGQEKTGASVTLNAPTKAFGTKKSIPAGLPVDQRQCRTCSGGKAGGRSPRDCRVADCHGGEQTMWKRIGPVAFAALCVQSPVLAEEADIGARLYQESCSGCHGATGKGGGELSQLLNIQTPALTGLSKAHDGKFPMLDVIHIIDGRSGVRGHGGPMPIFGSLYSASSVTAGTDYGSVMEVRGRILSLAMYLEAIQE